MNGVDMRRVAVDEADMRLDRWFKKHFPDLTHARLEKLLRTGQVRVDGRRAKAGTRLSPGQQIRIPPRLPAALPPAPKNRQAEFQATSTEIDELRARILYRDEWVIAVDKPTGLAVQGGSGQRRHLDAMLDALTFDAAERPRLVHRLDRDTAGVLLLARNVQAARRLTESFKRDEVRKLYWALVAGVPKTATGTIRLPLGKRAGPGGERIATDAPGARPAETRFAVVATRDNTAAWLALRPLTGRTHQLRAHCAAIGHPILGDGKYGGRHAFLDKPTLPRRLMLLAREIALPHPEDETTLRITAPLPQHMHDAFAALGLDAQSAVAERVATGLEA